MAKKKPKAVPVKKGTPARKTPNLKTVFRPKSAADLLKVGRLADLTRPPEVKLGGRNSSTFTGALTNKTPSQVALESCQEWYHKLAHDHPEFISAVAAMIGLRRAYAIAYRELNDAIAAASEAQTRKGHDVPETLADYSVQLAMYQASLPFSEHDLMRGVLETVLPWLTEVVDRHTEADHKDAVEAAVEENERRRTRPVPVGLKHTPAQEGTSLTRDRALVLVGWRPAVLWLLDQACSEVLKARDEQVYTVLRLVQNAPKAADQHARLVRVGGGAWVGCTNSDRDIDAMVAKFVDGAVGSPIDLVVCDDLGVANTAGFVGRPRAACAGDANKRLRKWCDKIGAGLLAALPTPDKELPDFDGAEFEQLKTFTYMRPVQVLDGGEFGSPDHYRLVVGVDAAVFDVPKAVLDSYGSVSLIVPSDVVS